MPAFKRIDLSQIPSGQPPEGVMPNFVDPESIGYIPRIGIYILLPLMLIFLALRIGTRVKLNHVGADDILGNLLGRHQWDVPLSEVTNHFVRTLTISLIFSNFATMLIKVSLLLFYLRIFNPVLWARVAIWAGLVASVVFYAISNIVMLSVCVPPSGKTWLETAASPNCTSVEYKVTLAGGWFGTIADFFIIAIPVRLISTLVVNKQRKVGILAIFLTGLLACAASVAGLAQRYKLSYTDITYNDTLIFIYNIIEVIIAIICSCMPILAAPLRAMVTKMTSSWSYLKRTTKTLVAPKEATGEHSDKLPSIPDAKISGLRTFIRRFNRSTSQQSTVRMDISNFSKLGSVDDEYHRQLKAYHANEAAGISAPSTPGSRGRGM
ncbi:hypothetical protein J7T55_007380 [Diaporthe amygdali]|uniref:uncharacterized protein n=1 Tax=Phomopsis amygdali TaxID=1214568 RepID=UPI0022FE0F2B|nr:uncharacterized protein J7T55_007380 [Diaporthe amygdali]KAJ0116400.1 hypothetical protein J7T55_007380 [Diaporthe amygdali]